MAKALEGKVAIVEGARPSVVLRNGVLLIVAPRERKVRIEVGYGLEPVLTDALSSVIIQSVILPKFRDGDLPGGIVAGIIGPSLTNLTYDTLVPVYSATKGPAAATLLLALERRGLGPETPVREVWPGFPVASCWQTAG